MDNEGLFNRVVKLRIYDAGGAETDDLIQIKYGGGPTPIGFVNVTRGRYFKIIERILTHDDLVSEIVIEWRRQTLHWLTGAEAPLPYNWPNPHLFQNLCDPENPSEACLILASLRDIIENQIVDAKGSIEELNCLSPMVREYI